MLCSVNIQSRRVLRTASAVLKTSAEYIVSTRNMPCKWALEISSLSDLIRPYSPSVRTGCVDVDKACGSQTRTGEAGFGHEGKK